LLKRARGNVREERTKLYLWTTGFIPFGSRNSYKIII
jgi:hypothetical protein